VSDQPIATKRQERINTLARCVAIVAVLLIGACAGHPDELPRPREAVDAGDSYRLKDGSRVVLHRVVNEVAVKHLRSRSVEPIARQAGINRDPLVTIENGGSNIVDVYQAETAQAVDLLLNVQEDGMAVFPVLLDPASRRRMIATDEIIVQFESSIGSPEAVALLNQEGFEVVESPVPSAPGQYLVRIASGPDKQALSRAEQIAGRPGVEWASPDFLRELEFYFIPNDTHFDKQQYLRNIGQNGAVAGADVKAETAWDITAGHPEVVIAIIDTGVDIDHDELMWQNGKIFLNPGELGSGRETNGIDDDGNGYIDDWRGWDFYSQDNNPRPGSSGAAAHGTACAGIAAAQGNNIQGIAGIAYGCKILPIKISPDTGTVFSSDFDLGRAIRYAADYADVLSSSWGGGLPNDAISTAIDYATTSGRNGKGCGVFFASGNDGPWRPARVSVSSVPSGNYKFGFYLESSGIYKIEYAAIDQVRLLGQDGYTRSTQPAFFQDFEVGEPGWTVAHGGGATSDWTATTDPFWQLIGTGSTRS
jgi:subtilisin family serine protease